MNTQPDYGGIVARVIAGKYLHPITGKPVRVPIREISICASLDGEEANLYHSMHGKSKPCIVGDETTMSVLGDRVEQRLRALNPSRVVLHTPRSDMETVERLRYASRHAETLVAVGSGTVNDLVKYASFLDGKPYSVFPTSPMNAYTTGTASISEGGVKKSLPAHSASGVFFDLAILAACPDRLIANAFADVVCRTTAQVDWLLSQQVLNTFYDDISYILLAVEEAPLFNSASRLLERDLDALAALVRTCNLNGLSTALVGTTHAGSMAEHMISHYLDMFAGDKHPGTLHGEQVGVATISVLALQNLILGADAPPTLSFVPPDCAWLQNQFGDAMGREFAEGMARKTPSKPDVAKLNDRLQENWDSFVSPLREVMLSVRDVQIPMEQCGAPFAPSCLGFSADFYKEAVTNARCIRDRYTILDFAAAAGVLDGFIADEMVV